MAKISKDYKVVPIEDLIPYESNPRINDDAVEAVAESIKQCGNIDPIEVNPDMVILSGHTRLKALEQLGIKKTGVLIISGMTEEQEKKYRLLTNKTGEIAGWDFELLEEELDGLDFEGFDFGFEEDDLPDMQEHGQGVKEIETETYSDEKFSHTCPKCGFKFNE